jgi:alkaline phosphatase
LLGDLVYPYGSYKNYTESFKPLWQDLLLNSKAKFIITPGNHDYYKNNLEDYNLALKDTFGDRLISPTNSDFSSYQIVETNWQILNFNSNCEYTIGGCNQDSNQYQDISKELINSNKPCSIAIWHHPIFNNGRHISKENTSRMQAIYSELSKYNTEIILNGHDHNYQHFRDQDISTFIIGTGGVSLYPVNKNGSYLNMSYSFVDFGYLVLNLSEDEYRSYFQQVDGRIYDYNIKKCF